jgi:uncharacterized damage-inducible protein DinB
MLEHFTTLAHYNAWANGRIYETSARLSDENYRADLGAFFHSVHRTLNHILVGDQIWMHRMTGDGPSPTRLDEVPHDTLSSLTGAREAEDARIISFIEGLSADAMAGTFTYRNMSGAEFTQPLAPVLTHFFNHQTHHRGQVHALLTRLDEQGPELDLIYFLRERE